MRILSIDDDRACSLKLEFILQDYGELCIAESAEAGMALYDSAREKNEAYDIIFIDLLFPQGVDGIKVIQHIKEKEKNDGGQQSLLLVMSQLTEEDIVSNKYVRACHAFIPKPIERENIVKKIDELLAAR